MLLVVNGETIKLTPQQERFLKLLFKFRYVNAVELAKVVGIRSDNTYKVLEKLKARGLVTKVYKKEYRIHQKPAFYYLSKSGVTTVRKILDVKESVVHALYKKSSDEFIVRCQMTLACYNLLRSQLPPDTDIFTKTEINQDNEFPKNRPDLYIRTPGNKEFIAYIMTDQPNYIINKRIDEIITHCEDEGWNGDYPIIAFIVMEARIQNSILFKTQKKLEGIGMDENELTILVTSIDKLRSGNKHIWGNAFKPLDRIKIYS